MKLPQPRFGEQVFIRNRCVDFSLWPVRQARGGYTTNSRLFVAEPWPVISSVVKGLKNIDDREAGIAFTEQAQDFFQAALAANTAAAKPLLLYYCFLNLAKALILVRFPGTHLDGAKHGLSECLNAGKRELVDAYLEAHKTVTNAQVFDLLLKAIRGSGLAAKTAFDVATLMRQVVAGHRLYLAATGRARENFLSPFSIELLHDPNACTIWLRVAIASGDLARLGASQTNLLNVTALAPNWRAVASVPGQVVELEMSSPRAYTKGWLANDIMPVIDEIRHKLWQTILSVPPYRAYYLFLPPVAELKFVLPQILSSYALFFYFGSITRYRPHHFDRILDSSFGAFTESFLNEQPLQLLFLFASEFARRDVAKAALV